MSFLENKTPSILDFCPRTPRPIQKEILLQIERDYHHFDVFVCNLPTGLGKSFIALTLAKWLHKVHKLPNAILTPTNILRDQYVQETPGLHTLSNAGLYTCHNWDDETSCKVVKGKQKHYCKGCPYLSARKRSYVMPYAVYNSYIYLANRLHKSAIIYDEAHTAINLLQDRAKDRLWRHDYHYDNSIQSYQDLINWLRMRETKTGLDEKQQMLLDELTSGKPRYVVERGEDLYRGEMRDCLKLLPVDVRDQPPILWPPSKTRKIFLLSATIGKPDVVQLGLDKKRVQYYTAASPVDPARRPVTYMPVGSMSVATKARTLPRMLATLENIAARFPAQKGMLHCTYEVARDLQALMGDGPLKDRLLFHKKEDRTEVVNAFKAFPPESGKILVGCGLEEGLDLIGDLARFQVIVKVPWPSLEEPAIRYMAGQDPEWYNWQTVKKLLQASGRIVRSVSDYGETFVIDSSFQRLYDEARDMFPQWWLDALVQEDLP